MHLQAILALIFDPPTEAQLADLIIVQQRIAADDPVAQERISAGEKDPSVVLAPP